MTSAKGLVNLVHLYPREMSIYGDLGNTRCLATRVRRHGYDVVVHQHHPGMPLPPDPHLVIGGGGQDSGQSRVEDDLAAIGDRLHRLAADGVPMIMICGMYQMCGHAFITSEGVELPGLGILDVTTRGQSTRMIGGIVLDTDFGEVVGFENHSGATVLGPGQAPSAGSGPATATTAPTAPRAPGRTTSSAPTCTGRSCRPTRGWPTGSLLPQSRSRPAGRSSPACSTTESPTRPAPARPAGCSGLRSWPARR